MTTFQPELTYSLTMRATPDRVWAALTKASELRAWFAESVELEPRVGGAYRFFGRHSLGVPDAAAADQTITALEPERRLAFRWTWCGVPTEVELALRPDEWKEFTMGSNPPRRPNCPGCKVTVTQRFEGTLPFPRPEHLADDHWRMALANLFAHLDGAPVLLADHDDPTPEVRLSLVIDAPPSAVFRALTVPELVDQWIGIGSRVDLRVGGGFDFGWSACGAPESEPKPLEECPVKIVVLEQDRRLAITWPDWRGSPDVPDQEVRFELTPEGPGGKQTRVELLHTGFVRSVDRSDFTQGWYGFLEALADVAASAARTSAKRRG